MLGHVELGLRTIAPYLPRSLPAERRLALEHCVLMHHGGEAAGGARFASAEALALYRLNALDAGVKGAFEHGL
jgi:3'-5' exoribonuclease